MKIALFALLAVALAPFQAFCGGGDGSAVATPHKILITFEKHKVVVSMFDTPTSRDFLTLLPLELEFEDFAGEEKIAYLPRKLDTSGVPASEAVQGDFTYYKPWGNLAVFYKGHGGDGQLAVLGRIESGKAKLAPITGNFTATIEAIK